MTRNESSDYGQEQEQSDAQRSHVKYAIIGAGPRGGYALERLIVALNGVGAIHRSTITVFEESAFRGCGPVYAPDQPTTNWINVTERALALDGRDDLSFDSSVVAGFPSYHEWAGVEVDSWAEDRTDEFPARATVGRYLRERFDSLAVPLTAAGRLEVLRGRVDQVTYSDGRTRVATASGESATFDEVLVTVGHQPTELDSQLKDWEEATADHAHLTLCTSPYPILKVLDATGGASDLTVAIRGYGLAMIDVARALAERFGCFQIEDAVTREQSFALGERALAIVPFSLDGLTMGPKPLHAQIDGQFEPTSAEMTQLKRLLSDPQELASATSRQLLVDAVAPIVASRFADLEQRVPGAPTCPIEAKSLVANWLNNPDFGHECVMDPSIPPIEALGVFIGMATGVRPIYLDYCAGQVWRHCQPTIYSCLSHSELANDVLAEIIGLDERLKRYAFGPPVESLQQLKALAEAGVLKLDQLDDPEIACDERGWTLAKGEVQVTATIMVNSVLDTPKIESVVSPFLSSLLDGSLMQAVHDDLGVLTDDAGYLKTAREDGVLPIALLGRLAKGTIIGVDAILECFGDRPEQWAQRAAAKGRAR